MKKFVIKSLSLLMVLLTLISIIPFSSSAASVRYYQTKQDNVILRTGPASSYKDNTITVQYKGTVLKVVSQTTNSSGNVWYKLDNGYWVFSDRVKAHTHSYYGGICTGRNCGFVYPLTVTSFSATVVVTNGSGAKGWSRPYSENSTYIKTYAYGTVLKIVAKTTNIDSKGNAHNLWLKLEDGNWVYSGKVTRRYTVSYNENGGSGAPSNQYFLSGSTLTLSSKKPSRVGYTFKGWSTSSSSSTVSYTPGDKYSAKKSLTLYAVWAKCSHSYVGGICTKCKYEYPLKITALNGTFVVTNADGAIIRNTPYNVSGSKIRTAAKNSVLTVVSKTTNQKGNVWYKLSNGNWVYSGNVTQRFTVKYNANGGTNAPSAQNFLSGKTLTLSAKKPERIGYNFKGWTTSASSNKVSYNPGAKYSTKKDITLYAVWAKCSHSYVGGICTKCNYEYPLKITTLNGTFVVTNADGAIIRNTPYNVSGSKIRTAAKNSVLTVVSKTTNQKGNVWYKLSNGNWVYSGNVTQRFTVKYNANGGTNAPSTQYFFAGKSVKIRTSIPSNWGYAFKGWATSKNSSKVVYEPGSSYSKKQDVTLYAVWEKCSYASTKIFKNSTSAFEVPGLDEDFVPQGICYIESMGVYAISGYVEDQVSRIYLVNADTGSVKRINLKNFTAHAGGIASNGSDVWVSSGGNANKGGYVYHTTVNALKKVANNGMLKFDGKFQTLVKGSALYCSDDTLWVCEFYADEEKYHVNKKHHYKNNHAWACGYELPIDVNYTKGVELLPDMILSIPDKVQGMCITDDGDVIFSTSLGSTKNSYLLAYQPVSKWQKTTTTVNKTKIPMYAVTSSNLIAKIQMPTLMEGLDFHNGKMYVVFESGAEKYSDAKEVIPYAWKTNIKNVLKAYK